MGEVGVEGRGERREMQGMGERSKCEEQGEWERIEDGVDPQVSNSS